MTLEGLDISKLVPEVTSEFVLSVIDPEIAPISPSLSVLLFETNALSAPLSIRSLVRSCWSAVGMIVLWGAPCARPNVDRMLGIP